MHEVTQASPSIAPSLSSPSSVSALSPLLTILGWKDLRFEIQSAEKVDQILTQQLQEAYDAYQVFPNTETKGRLVLAIDKVIEKLARDQARAEELQAEANARLKTPSLPDSRGLIERFSNLIKQRLQQVFNSTNTDLVKRYTAISQERIQAIRKLSQFKQALHSYTLPKPRLGNFDSSESSSLISSFKRSKENGVERRLQEISSNTMVNTQIADQIIPIGEQYTYDLGDVFSADYTIISGAEVGEYELPNWLNIQYKPGISYSLLDDNETMAVALSKNTAFLAYGMAGLQILDVTNLTQPKWQGQYLAKREREADPAFVAQDIFISENTAFIAYGKGGIHILDIRDRSNPMLLGNYTIDGGEALSITVFNHIALTAYKEEGVLMLDVSDATKPKLLGSYSPKDIIAYDVFCLENTAFIAYGTFGSQKTAGLQLINITDPSKPRFLSNYTYTAKTDSAKSVGVTVYGKTVFLAGDTDGLHILDAKDMKNLKYIGKYVASSGRALNTIVSGKTAFLAYHTGGVHLLDITDLSRPKLMGVYKDKQYARHTAVSKSENMLFIAYGVSGLEIIDTKKAVLSGLPLENDVVAGKALSIVITAKDLNTTILLNSTFSLTPNNIPKLVQNSLTDQTVFPNQSLSLQIYSEQIFTNPSSSFLRLSLTEITTNLLPKWLSLKESPTRRSIYSPVKNSAVYAVTLQGDIAFVSYDNAGLHALDISDVKKPRFLWNYPIRDGNVRSVVVLKSTLFLACREGGVHILDVSNLMSPKLIGRYLVEGSNSLDLAVAENTMFIAQGKAGVHVVNITIPEKPIFVGNYTSKSSESDVDAIFVSGKVLFLAYESAGLHIVSINNLSSPTLLGNYTLSNAKAYGVSVVKNTAFVAYREAGLRILDVTNLTHPHLIGSYTRKSKSGWVHDLVISGNIVVLSYGSAGIEMIDVSDPVNPIFLGGYPAGSGYSWFSQIDRTTLYLANGKEGLYILDLSSWELTAQPALIDGGNYPLRLKATDIVGSSIYKDFTIRVEGPPQVMKSIVSQYVEVDKFFYFPVPFDTFSDPNFDPLVYGISQIGQVNFPLWLDFNRALVTLSGTPHAPGDLGTLSLRLTAQDPLKQSASIDFNLTIVYVPEVNQDIPGQPLSLVQKRKFNYPLFLGNIFNGHNKPLTYGIEQRDEHDLLPNWLTVVENSAGLTLSGEPNTLGEWTLLILARDPLNHSIHTPFVINVHPNFPPLLRQPILPQNAAVGELFYFLFPLNTFKDVNGDLLRYEASLEGNTTLPGWLSFTQKGDFWYFEGKPGQLDTGFFYTKKMVIQVTAYDIDGAGTTTVFNLNVGGKTIYEMITGIGGGLLSLFGILKYRSTILNRINYSRRETVARSISLGGRFSLELGTPVEKVAKIEAKTFHVPSSRLDCQQFIRKRPFHFFHYCQLPYDYLPEGTLPSWMWYNKSKNSLDGIIPADMADNSERFRLFIFVKDSNDIVQEHFTINVRQEHLQEEEENIIPGLGAPLLRHPEPGVELMDRRNYGSRQVGSNPLNRGFFGRSTNAHRTSITDDSQKNLKFSALASEREAVSDMIERGQGSHHSSLERKLEDLDSSISRIETARHPEAQETRSFGQQG